MYQVFKQHNTISSPVYSAVFVFYFSSAGDDELSFDPDDIIENIEEVRGVYSV